METGKENTCDVPVKLGVNPGAAAVGDLAKMFADGTKTISTHK